MKQYTMAVANNTTPLIDSYCVSVAYEIISLALSGVRTLSR